MRVEAARGYLSNEVSMPLALVLNELLTNAAKHGMNGHGSGEITVKLYRADGQIVLSVEDDGPGFNLEETGQRSSGLGLVRGLSRQLHGTFSVERGANTRCIVRFPDTCAT